MQPIVMSRVIKAGAAEVFDVVSAIDNYSKAVPQIARVEFLTPQHAGMGTRFRETRLMNGKEYVTELEVTEFVDNERIRLVSDAGGTTWDTAFVVRPHEAGAELTLTMHMRPQHLVARLMLPLIRGMVTKGVAADMEAVKAYCEREL